VWDCWRKTIYSRDIWGCLLAKCGETQVSARRTGVKSLNMQETGANLGHLP